MAMNPRSDSSRTRGTPPWAVAVFLGGLVLVFLGERVLPGITAARWTLVGLGAAAAIFATALRWSSTVKSTEERKTIELALAILSSVGIVALLAYFTTAEPVTDWLGISGWTAKRRDAYESIVICVWVALIVGSTVPQVFAELALYPMRHAERVEWRRVRAALFAGLTLSVASAYGTLVTYASDELEVRADFSYFRTSRPSEPTIKMIEGMTQPIKVLAFFPPVSEVNNEVSGYLQDLSKRSPEVQVEQHDRLLVPKLAKESRVTKDGVIVVQREEQREIIDIGTDIKAARPKLKKLDAEMQKALMKVLRKQRTAYLTVGHGEINDKKADPEAKARTVRDFRDYLQQQNYRIRDLGMIQGLGTEVPNDATFVMVLGPSEPFAPEEIDTLKRYLERGGHLLMAVDPEDKVDAEPLLGILGLSLKTDVLCNDKVHWKRRNNESDRALILTDRFSSHASVSTLIRMRSRPVTFFNAGALEKTKEADKALKVNFTVRSMSGTWADLDGNFTFDSAAEKRTSHNLVAAISKPVAKAKEDAKTDGKDKPGDKGKSKVDEQTELRAVVMADVDALSDAVVRNPNLLNGNPQFVIDVVRWLGGEERFSGEEPTVGDVKIEHTKQKDAVLYYLVIFGAPALVLGLGLAYTRRGRGRARKKKAA